MKHMVSSLLCILLLVPTLAGCGLSFGQPPRDLAAEFDRLAHYVPATAQFPLFFDLKPEGDVGERWADLRARLEADGSNEALFALVFGAMLGQSSMLGQFQAESLGLMDVIDGPAVAGQWNGMQYAILKASSEREAREALIRNLGDESAWERKSFNGHTLYYGEFIDGSGQTTYLAWTIADGLVFLAYNTTSLWFHKLEALLSLPDENTLAAQPLWRVLHARLPEGIIAASCTVPGSSAAGAPPPAAGDDPLSALTYYLDAVMLAGAPEPEGVRIYLDGAFADGAEDVPAFQSLFALPPVDAAAWPALPAETALAVVSHDLSTVWPWVGNLFGIDQPNDEFAAGLINALIAPGGPLSGSFAVAITPPLPGQPVLSDVPAFQFLATSPDTTGAQMEALRAAVESSGAVFGDDTVDGLAIRRLVGTEASGYAPAYGLGDVSFYAAGSFYAASSPEAIGQALAAQREGRGLVTQPAYQVFLQAVPDRAFYVGYIDGQHLLSLNQANTPADQPADDWLTMAGSFDGLGLGVAVTPERVDGVLYLVILEPKGP